MPLLLDVGERQRATIAKMVVAVWLAGSMMITSLEQRRSVSSSSLACCTRRSIALGSVAIDPMEIDRSHSRRVLDGRLVQCARLLPETDRRCTSKGGDRHRSREPHGDDHLGDRRALPLADVQKEGHDRGEQLGRCHRQTDSRPDLRTATVARMHTSARISCGGEWGCVRVELLEETPAEHQKFERTAPFRPLMPGHLAAG